jgi:hypothetical protein
MMKPLFPVRDWYWTSATAALVVIEHLADVPSAEQGGRRRADLPGRRFDPHRLFSAVVCFRDMHEPAVMERYDWDRFDVAASETSLDALNLFEDLVEALTGRWGWSALLLSIATVSLGQILAVLAVAPPTLTRPERRVIRELRPNLVALLREAERSTTIRPASTG